MARTQSRGRRGAERTPAPVARHRQQRSGLCHPVSVGYDSGRGGGVPADRKSTRLNSSHPSISPLSLHDALPIFAHCILYLATSDPGVATRLLPLPWPARKAVVGGAPSARRRRWRATDNSALACAILCRWATTRDAGVACLQIGRAHV